MNSHFVQFWWAYFSMFGFGLRFVEYSWLSAYKLFLFFLQLKINLCSISGVASAQCGAWSWAEQTSSVCHRAVGSRRSTSASSGPPSHGRSCGEAFRGPLHGIFKHWMDFDFLIICHMCICDMKNDLTFHLVHQNPLSCKYIVKTVSIL